MAVSNIFSVLKHTPLELFTSEYILSNKHGIIADHDIQKVEYCSESQGLRIVATGDDPIILLPKIELNPDVQYCLHIEATGPCSNWQLHFCTDKNQKYTHDRVINFDPTKKNTHYNGALFILPDNILSDRLRIDTGSKPGEYLIHTISILRIPNNEEMNNFNPLLKVICHRCKDMANNDWLDLLCLSLNNSKIGDMNFPKFPDEHMQICMVGTSGEATLREIYKFYEEIHNSIDDISWNFNNETKILDFGCGFGRLTRFFLKDTYGYNIFGTDTTLNFLNVCKSTFSAKTIPKSNFVHNESFPPSRMPDNFFDLVTAYSVFTHLSEEAAMLWIDEIYRILKPGGLFALTLRQKTYLERCALLKKQKNLQGYAQIQAEAFGDSEVRMAQYEQGKYIYYPSGGGADLSNEFYGDTVIPEAYVQREWTRNFIIRDMFDDPSRVAQSFLLLQAR